MADLSGLQTDYNIQNKEFKEVSETEYFAMIHPDDRVKMYKALKQLSTDKTARMKETYRLVYKETGNKRIEWIQLQASVDKYDEKREVMILIGVALVITPFKQLEEELIKARFRAEESNRLKSAFLANISHEIRTPLNAIVGFSELLLTEENAKTQQEYINIIKTNNELLLQLINDVLDLSKIETGKLEFTNTIFDLNNLISEIEDIMHLRLKNNQVQFQIELPQSSCMIRSEKNRLTQVLTNLLNNSIKFTSQGYIKFGYSLDRQMLYFFVEDTGCGIPPDRLDHIFEKFTKLNPFVQETGLGLSICQTIIHHLGGEINVTSEPDKGTCFQITLPYKNP